MSIRRIALALPLSLPRSLPLALAACTLSTLVPMASLAQSSRGVVTGLVTDAAGAALPNAEVTLRSKLQDTATIAHTNQSGIYRFDGVTPGDYSVRVTASGFATTEQSANVVVGATVGRDFTLSVGAATDLVEVTANNQELQTEDAVRGGTIAARDIAELPISGQNSLNLLLTVPGVARSNQGGSLDSGIGSVNGARARSNNFLLDGIQNNDISISGPQYVITNNDVLQEVNFQTSNFSPEFGRAGGAVVSQITKSGGNAFHGTVALIYQSQLFSATTQLERSAYASNIATYNAQQAAGNTAYPLPQLKNKFHRFRPAATIGGPIIIPGLYNGKDRTFFFGGGQLFRDRYNSLATFTNVPTATGYTTLRTLAASANCTNAQFYLNLMNTLGNPTSSFQQAATSIAVPTATLASAPTCNGTNRAGQTLATGQYYRAAREASDDDNFIARVDHKASSKQSLLFRFLFDDTVDNLGGSEAIAPLFDVPSRGRTLGATFNDVYQIKSSLVNEFRFGYTRSSTRFNIPSTAGLGLTLPAYSAAGLNIPSISSSFNQGRISNSFEYEDVVTFIRGHHAFKAGVALLRQLAVQQAPFNGRGTIGYSAITSAASYQGSGAVTALANFIDGYAGTSSAPVNKLFDQITPTAPGTYRPNLFTQAYFLQDTWKASPDLTLVYGFRYENFGQPANSNTFTHPAFTGYGTTDYLSTARVAVDNNNIGPTFGFSYNPHVGDGLFNGRTVIRGGYQVTYDTFYNNLLSNMKAASPNSPSNLTSASVVSATTPRGTNNLPTQLANATPTLNPYTAESSDFRQKIRNPYYHHFTLGLQEEVGKRMVLDVAYVGTLGRQLFFTNPLNPAVPNATFTQTASQTVAINGVNTTQTTRVYANRGVIQLRDSGLTSNYHALQVQFRHRGMETPAGRVSFSSSYTLSKSMDVLSETFATNSSAQNPSRSINSPLGSIPYGYLDYGPSDNDRRHISSTVINWQIRGPHSGFLERALAGWSVAPILQVQSGNPYTILQGSSGDRDLDGSTLGDRPDIGNKNAPFDSRGQYVSTSVCASGIQNLVTSACTTADNVKFILQTGYAPNSTRIEGRNSNYTTRYLTLDANLLKKIRIVESVNLELRGEFFNVTNNQNFDTPSAYRDLTQYGNATSFLNTTLQTGGSRTFRVGAKVLF